MASELISKKKRTYQSKKRKQPESVSSALSSYDPVDYGTHISENMTEASRSVQRVSIGSRDGLKNANSIVSDISGIAEHSSNPDIAKLLKRFQANQTMYQVLVSDTEKLKEELIRLQTAFDFYKSSVIPHIMETVAGDPEIATKFSIDNGRPLDVSVSRNIQNRGLFPSQLR